MCYNNIYLHINTFLSSMLTQLCYHLKRKTFFSLTSYNVCISTLDLKLEKWQCIQISTTNLMRQLLIQPNGQTLFVGLEVPIIGPHTFRYVLDWTPMFLKGMWVGVDMRMNTKNTYVFKGKWTTTQNLYTF